MMVGPGKWIVLIVVILLLFGYKRLPAISRSIGQSFRIAKSELKGLDPNDVRTRARAQTGRGKLGEYRRTEQQPTTQHDAEGRPDDER